MTVDITALASAVRRLDLSATFKTFVALFSILLVITNLTIIFTFLLSTLLLDWFDIDDAGIYIAIILTFIVFSIAPLGFIFWDWMVRQPWRHLAAISGAAIGAVGFAAIGIGIGFFEYSVLENFDAKDSSAGLVNVFIVGTVLIGLVAWLISDSRRVRLIISGSGGLLLAFLLISFFYENWLASIVDDPTTRMENTIYATSLAISAATIIWLFIRLVRNRITLSSNQPRQLLLGALYRKGFWVRLAFLVGLPSSLWHARALKTPAFWFFLFSRPLVYVGFLFVLTNAYPDLALRTRIAVGAVIVIVGHLMFYSGKRLAARYIWNPENPIDSRNPILFLRSFEDDQLAFKRPWWDLFGHWIDLWSFRRNMDEALIDEIAQYGPVVALGMPGEEKIPFGAIRYYSSHDDWQKIISDTAKRAQTVVISAGQTPGVLWEYGLIASEGLLDKTLLLFPPSSDDKSTGTAELIAFRDATNLSGDFQIAEDGEPIALVPTADGPTLLTGRETNAAAYVAAARAHFQKCNPSHLVDSLAH